MSRDSKERPSRAAPVADHAAPATIRSLKADLRKDVLARRDAMSPAERASSSERITVRLLDLDAYRDAGCVMAYVGFGSEIDTARFVATTLAQGKTLVLPRVERGSRALGLYAVQDPERQLEAGVWGIRQPRAGACPEVAASQVEFVLVPGVAFTRTGERLGYGGGFYDRLICGFEPRPALIAAAFELQVMPELPMSETDQRVDGVITEGTAYGRRADVK
jgi:5-formyltetrahydrofolate cyclo-ligase